MKILYYTIRNYSKLFLHKIPSKQNMFVGIYCQILKISSSAEHSNTTPAEIYIIKSLDDLKIKYKNQFTCFLTKCVFCNNLSLHINKITGKYKKKYF